MKEKEAKVTCLLIRKSSKGSQFSKNRKKNEVRLRNKSHKGQCQKKAKKKKGQLENSRDHSLRKYEKNEKKVK